MAIWCAIGVLACVKKLLMFLLPNCQDTCHILAHTHLIHYLGCFQLPMFKHLLPGPSYSPVTCMNMANGSSDPSEPEEVNTYPETMHFMEALAWGHPK